MKKLMLLLVICICISCKKSSKNSGDPLTQNNWVLETATVSPAMTIGSKTSTDYKNLMGPGSCLASNYTISFAKEGTYTVGSNGALCDMFNTYELKTWSRNGDQITLSKETSAFTLKGDFLTNTTTFTNPDNKVTYTILYVYRAKSK